MVLGVSVLLESRPDYAILFAVCSKVMHVLSCYTSQLR